MIQATILDAAGKRSLDPTPENLAAALSDGTCTLWVDMQEATPTEAELLSSVFSFHPLAIEDCLGHVEHPKLDDYGSYLYVVAHGLACSDTGDELQTRELDFFLGPNYLLTYHHEPLPCVTTLWNRVARDERYLQRGPDGLAHAIIDLLVDELIPVIDRLDDTVEKLEEEILDRPERRTVSRILAIKRATLQLRRTVGPQREVVFRLSRDDLALVRPKVRLYFRDVYDHLVRIVDMNDALRDLVAGALEIYLSTVSNRMNEIMKVLTMVTTVFMPLGLLAGIYGMNFRYMPGLESPSGFVVVSALMAVIALGMLYWFRRRGWM